MKYTFDKKIDRNKLNKYIGFCYSVKHNEENPVDDINYDKQYYFAKYDEKDKGPEVILNRDTHKMIPMIKQFDPSNRQRSVYLIFGKAGSGKSVLTNRICELYKLMNPTKKIFFITNNNYMKDTALTHSIYEFLNLNEIIAKYSNKDELDAFRTGTEYDDSLMVFDDVDLNDNVKAKKIYYAFLGIILKFKRKNLISTIITTHDISDYGYTRLLFVELDGYIMYNGGLQNRSNRVLETYLKLTKDEIRRITDNKSSRWTCILTDLKTVMTENEIYSLK